MDQEQRDAIKAANKRRSNCPKCGASGIDVRDGAEVGGLPGIKYRRQAIAKELRKWKNTRGFIEA